MQVIKFDAQGRALIPKKLRNTSGLSSGNEVVGWLNEGRLVLEPRQALLERTRNLASISEAKLRRFAAEAARDREASALWAPTEAYQKLNQNYVCVKVLLRFLT